MNDGLLISVEFWLTFALFVVIDRALVGLLSLRLRYLWTAAASAGFLAVFTSIGMPYLVALYVSLTVIFLAARRAMVSSDRAGAPYRLLLIMGVVATVWALGKIGSSIGISHLAWLFFLGASFLLVKIWTFCKDLQDRRIPEPSLPVFLAYCTYFPCFVSGPMHYYNEFQSAFAERTRLGGAALVDSVFRILHGLVKVLIVAVALRPFSLDTLQVTGLSEISLIELSWRSVIYSLVIYLDFSGYSDIAISSGRLAGVTVPENFRLPYLASNLRAFWQRWHITFTRFLTQYVFIPFVRTFQARAGKVSAKATASLAYIVTFLFCGFWHGSTANFLMWGLYHGAGLAAYDLYRQRRLAAARVSGRPLQTSTHWGQGLSALVTFSFVSLGWVFFTLPLGFWFN